MSLTTNLEQIKMLKIIVSFCINCLRKNLLKSSDFFLRFLLGDSIVLRVRVINLGPIFFFLSGNRRTGTKIATHLPPVSRSLGGPVPWGGDIIDLFLITIVCFVVSRSLSQCRAIGYPSTQHSLLWTDISFQTGWKKIRNAPKFNRDFTF